MAATVAKKFAVEMDPFVVVKMTLTGLTSDLLEAISHGGPTGAAPSEVYFSLTTRPTSGVVVGMSWESSSTSADTVSVRFYGGDLTDAVVDLYVKFRAMASNSVGTNVARGSTTIP